MKPSSTLMPALVGAMLLGGGLMIAAAPRPETNHAHAIAPTTINERPNEVIAAGLGYEIVWSTIDAGGGTSAGPGGFELSGTIGQPDAGKAGGGAFVLSGGYWAATLAEATQPCTGDLNADGVVDASDLGILLAAFGNSAAGDLNASGITDATDLGILLAVFGNTCD